MKPTHTPGSAAWERVSPSKLCFLSTAKLPSTPLLTPNRAAPSTTF